jgi:hypothetical protein
VAGVSASTAFAPTLVTDLDLFLLVGEESRQAH